MDYNDAKMQEKAIMAHGWCCRSEVAALIGHGRSEIRGRSRDRSRERTAPSSAGSAAASAPSAPADRSNYFQRFFPQSWLDAPILSVSASGVPIHRVPLNLRMATAIPWDAVDTMDPDTLRKELLSSVWCALRYSTLWSSMATITNMPNSVRKPLSHLGACIARETKLGIHGSAYEDIGNTSYTLILKIIAMVGKAMGMSPQWMETNATNRDAILNWGGDCVEACIGQALTNYPDNEWWLVGWKLDHKVPVENTAARLLLCVAQLENLTLVMPERVVQSQDMQRFIDFCVGSIDIAEFMRELDAWKAETEGGDVRRRRSWGGDLYRRTRDAERLAHYRAYGQYGKGDSDSKGKGDGKGKGKGKGKKGK